MTARLIMISHASTDAVRKARFPADEPLDERGKTHAAELAGKVPSADRCWTSPELRTRQTAEGLRLDANVQSRLRECDYGRWTGSTISEVSEREPHAVNTWLRDPTTAPHGGETILAFIQRVTVWLADEQAHDRRSVIVSHSTIIRAAIVGAMEAPPHAFWRVDIAPLSVTRLSSSDGRWRVLSSGCAL